MDNERLYQQRLARYITAMRNEKPDGIRIRPFVAEFTARHTGYTCQDVAHDYTKAFDAAVKCAKDFDWDAVVPNMVYVWTGLAQAIGLRYYGIPGIHIPPTTGSNYIEPPDDRAWMRTEAGAVSAIAGIFKAPFDILADKLRGYIGLTMDMATQPDKVLAACEALMPHLCHVGLATADTARAWPPPTSGRYC